MGKGSKSVQAQPLSAEDIHNHFKQGNKTNDYSNFDTACTTYLEGLTPGRLETLIHVLCEDPDQVKCEEFGRTAAVVLKISNRWTYCFVTQIQLESDRRRRRTISDHFTEREENIGHNFVTDFYKAIIPFANAANLESVAGDASGLAAMMEILTECPDVPENLDRTAPGAFFYDLDSPLAKELSPEDKQLVEKRNDALWYLQKLSKRIAVGFGGKKCWDIVDVGDEDLLEEIQRRKDSLEEGFQRQLREATKPVKAENEDSDDTETLVDFRV